MHEKRSSRLETLAAQHLVRQKEVLASCEASCVLYFVHFPHSGDETLAAQHLLVRQEEELVCCAALSAAYCA